MAKTARESSLASEVFVGLLAIVIGSTTRANRSVQEFETLLHCF